MTELLHRAPLAPAIVVRFEELVDEELREAAVELEVSIAELIRCAVDAYFEQMGRRF